MDTEKKGLREQCGPVERERRIRDLEAYQGLGDGQIPPQNIKYQK